MKKIEIIGLEIEKAGVQVLEKTSLSVMSNEIFAVIGPAKSGKREMLTCINRMIELYPEYRVKGRIMINGKSIYRAFTVTDLRRKAGMVFAVPNPLPFTVFENIAYGLRLIGKKDLMKHVEHSLKVCHLWDEVKDRLDEPAGNLSGGQKQRLCLARCVALRPEILLFHEPCSALDPISTSKIEDSMRMLRKKHTIVLVTNNTKQAARVSDRTAFLLSGKLIEIGETARMFTAPKDKRTADYISGKFG